MRACVRVLYKCARVLRLDVYVCASGAYTRLDTLLLVRKDGLEGADSRGVGEGLDREGGAIGGVHRYNTTHANTHTDTQTYVYLCVHSHS